MCIRDSLRDVPGGADCRKTPKESAGGPKPFRAYNRSRRRFAPSAFQQFEHPPVQRGIEQAADLRARRLVFLGKHLPLFVDQRERRALFVCLLYTSALHSRMMEAADTSRVSNGCMKASPSALMSMAPMERTFSVTSAP